MAEQRRSGFAQVNSTKLYYEVAGEGYPLVLNHGGLVDNHLWDEQFDEFARHFKVVRYDIRGFGASGLVKKGMEPYSQVDDLYGLLQFLGIEKTYILGLSMGGALAIDFTLQHPEMVDALITVGAGLSGFKMGDPGEKLRAQFAEMEDAFKRGDIERSVEVSLQIWTDGPQRTPQQVDPAVRERVRVMTAHNYARDDDEGEDVEPQPIQPPAVERLAEIGVPTLIIVGDKDNETIFAIADTLEQDIAGAKRVWLSNAAHHPNMERPQEFNKLVIDFLKGIK